MGKVVINKCYGGFGLSQKAIDWFLERNLFTDLIIKYEEPDSMFGKTHGIDDWKIPRHHPDLIKCVEELGDDVNLVFSDLEIVEFEGDLYRINEYGGYESVETPDDIRWTNVNEY